MAKTWTLTELVAQFREYTGRPTNTNQISDDTIKILINDYYVNHFPSDAKVDEFNTFYTQALSATDDGIYPLPQSVARFDDPVTINGVQIRFYRDRELFFSDWKNNQYGYNYPSAYHFRTSSASIYGSYEDEQYITEPGLVIGSSDSTKVKNVAFDYSVDNFSYSKALAESALTGSAVPQGKYGAWSLKVDENGVVTVSEATSNSVGYLTPRLALEDLGATESDNAYMGYVTAIKSDGAFTPDTTALDAANVTATFTDGRFDARTTPISALLYGQDLYVWPKPNDIYQFKALQIAERPDELSSDSDTVEDPKWGPAVAMGTANVFLLSKGEKDTVDDLAGLTKYLFSQITQDRIKRLLGHAVAREY